MALFLYSLLPIVRNTHAGLASIPRSVRESAEALGLPPMAILRLVELPMAGGSIRRRFSGILEHLGEPTRPPPIASVGGPAHEDSDRYDVDAYASSDPLPLYEFDRRVSW